jgi:uncharacterized protein
MAAKPETQFIRACSTGKLDVVRQLLRAGLSPDVRDSDGLTGLIWAGRKGQVEVAKVLLAESADLEAKDRRGRTAIFHAIAYKRYEYVQFIASRGAALTHVDLHGWTALDLASMPRNPKMVELLAKLGAPRRSTQDPPPPTLGLNRFGSGGGATGGPNLPIEVERIHVQLHTLFHRWRGEYSPAVEGFGFPRYVDGSLIRYTEQLNILGPQKAQRGGNWLMVKLYTGHAMSCLFCKIIDGTIPSTPSTRTTSATPSPTSIRRPRSTSSSPRASTSSPSPKPTPNDSPLLGHLLWARNRDRPRQRPRQRLSRGRSTPAPTAARPWIISTSTC